VILQRTDDFVVDVRDGEGAGEGGARRHFRGGGGELQAPSRSGRSEMRWREGGSLLVTGERAEARGQDFNGESGAERSLEQRDMTCRTKLSSELRD